VVAEDEAAWAPILHGLGRDDEAERLLRHAIDVLEETFGPKHPEVAGAWNNLAAVLQKRGDYEEADDAYRRALTAKELLLGREHPSVGITLNNLAVNARKRGRSDEAEALYRRALSILDGRVEPDHPNLLLTRRNYAKLLRSLDREDEAEAIDAAREEAGHPARLEGTATDGGGTTSSPMRRSRHTGIVRPTRTRRPTTPKPRRTA